MSTSTTTPTRPEALSGGPTRFPLVVFAAGVLLGGLVIGLLGWTSGGTGEDASDAAASDAAGSGDEAPGDTAPGDEVANEEAGDGTEPPSMEEIVAGLSAEYDAEQRRLAEELTDEARHVHEDLLPLLAGLDAAMPVLAPAGGRAADAATVEGWQAQTQEALARLAPFGLGSPAFNGTHGTLLGAVRQLDAAVATYAEALEADAPAQARLVALAAEQRDHAVELWAIGAEQLDELNIAADLGHVHLFLPVDGDPASVPQEFHGHDHDGDDHDGDADEDHDDH